jgi:hypothetical protein
MRCRKNPFARNQRTATEVRVVNVKSNLPRKLTAGCPVAIGNTNTSFLHVNFPSDICTDINAFNTDTGMIVVYIFLILKYYNFRILNLFVVYLWIRPIAQLM